MGLMKRIVCKIVGHRDYDPQVLVIRPWEDPDFYSYAQADFRESACLRCGEALSHVAA
jgi:hypothetical protein